MPLFSERIGAKPIRDIIQRESADEDLRNALWNIVYTTYFNNLYDNLSLNSGSAAHSLILKLWGSYYKNRIDELFFLTTHFLAKLKVSFTKGEWYEVYDILEFLPQNYSSYSNEVNNNFISNVNNILQEHLSAYRFVNKQIAEISSNEEIQSIENAVADTFKFKPVQIHLQRALGLFSDRKNPDYRNSIKESISAIESFCSIVTKNPKATLGQALKEVEKSHELHPALKSSFSSLYGYTSDENGIRHALLDESTLKQEDAKFMLVACSAFINYLLVKTSEKK